MNNAINLYELIPAFPLLLQFETFNAEYLAALFVSFMLLVFVWFIVRAWIFFARARKRVRALKTRLTPKKGWFGGNKKPISPLWEEFRQGFIEVQSVDAQGQNNVRYYNTIDSSHFFNTATLAPELTENRLLAAVPSFLTGIGVLGTFIGLQLGLSELNIGNDVAVEEMKAGLAQVISGAKIAFLTSVWGVGLSLLFNFIEKGLERRIRSQINQLQQAIDKEYPRFIPELQLQQLTENSEQMRESLQHLGEKIGERLQSAIADLGDRIIEPISGLAGEAGDASKNVLDALIKEFIDQFRQVGGNQAEEMKKANERFATALNSLDSSVALLIKQLEDNQEKNASREQELMGKMAEKIDELVTKSREQHKMLAEVVGKTLGDIGKGEEARNESTNQLLQRLEGTLQNQLEASQQLLKQGEELQDGINATIQHSVTASASMKETASELNQATQHLKGTGYSLENAGKTLSGAMTQAANSTSDLAQENKAVSTLLNTQQQALNMQHQRIQETTAHINTLFDKAEHSFGQMDQQQREFLKGLAEHVNKLSEATAKHFDDYAKGLSQATETQLTTFIKHTTGYTTAMNDAINALRAVVDEIDGKLGTGR